jgi:anti-sigma factor RsiW
MRESHLSDEAVAAFSDGVLRGHARERAQRHTAQCPECAYAVAVQREAVWALRAAPAPSLPTALLDRLREVPLTTPIQSVSAALADDGTSMFAAFGAGSAAAFVPPAAPIGNRSWHLRPFVITTAAVAAASVLTVGSAGAASQSSTRNERTQQIVQTRDAGTPVPAP